MSEETTRALEALDALCRDWLDVSLSHVDGMNERDLAEHRTSAKFKVVRDALAALAPTPDAARLTEAYRLVDDLHGEVSRWVYLDETPDDPERPEDWRLIATDRAIYVLDAAARILAALVSGEGG